MVDQHGSPLTFRIGGSDTLGERNPGTQNDTAAAPVAEDDANMPSLHVHVIKKLSAFLLSQKEPQGLQAFFYLFFTSGSLFELTD